MEWKTHIAGGVLFGILGLLAVGPGPMRYFDMILWTVFWAAVPLVEVRLPLERRSPVFHSLFFAVAVAAAIYGASLVIDSPLLSSRGAIFAFLGILSHIVLDSLTSNGVPFLYPVISRRHVLFPHFGPTLRYSDAMESGRLQYLSLVLLIVLLILDVLEHSLW